MANFKFHIAFPVLDLEKTKHFYQNVLNCKIGRSAHNWIDINLFGHQVTAHYNPDKVNNKNYNILNDDHVPVNHFGIILPWREWHLLKDKLTAMEIPFLIAPRTVFEGEVGEQNSMFVTDPSGYPIEFKSFKEIDSIFKTA